MMEIKPTFWQKLLGNIPQYELRMVDDINTIWPSKTISEMNDLIYKTLQNKVFEAALASEKQPTDVDFLLIRDNQVYSLGGIDMREEICNRITGCADVKLDDNNFLYHYNEKKIEACVKYALTKFDDKTLNDIFQKSRKPFEIWFSNNKTTDLAVNISKLSLSNRLELAVPYYNNGEKHSLEKTLSDLISNDLSLLVKAIQVLEGNSPERIAEKQFNMLVDYFPEGCTSFIGWDLVVDDDKRTRCKNIRFMNDLNSQKTRIYKAANAFASEIRAAIPIEMMKTLEKELENKNNLPLGKIPTIEEALCLFSKEYKELSCWKNRDSAVIENETRGCYEIDHNIKIYNHPESEELILAGFTSYSPNYKQLFNSIHLDQEFETFENLCNKRVALNGDYLLAVAGHDVVDIYENEKQLYSLDKKIESIRQVFEERLTSLSVRHEKTLDLSLPKAKSEDYPTTFWNDQEIKEAFKEYGYISHKVDEKNELVVVYSQQTPTNGNPYCLQTFQGDGIKGFLIPLQNYIQDLYSVKPMHLKEGKEYYYTGGAGTEKIKYSGVDPQGRRTFEFSDSKNRFRLSPREVMEFIKSTEKQQNKLKL